MPRTRRFLLFTVGFILIFGLFLAAREARFTAAQTKPLTYPEIITALNTKVPNRFFRNKAQLVNRIISDVKKRKVDRPLTRDHEELLRQAGATDLLIETIRANSPPLPTPTPTPRVTPTPTPPRTPTPTPTPTPKPREIRNSIAMEFALIPPGSFMMGSPDSEKDRSRSEGPLRRVTIDYDFYIGRHEVTIGQWRAVTGDLPDGMKINLDAKFKENDNQPVVRVSWNDAKDFIAQLNARGDGFTYRLPTEAEWEYAARARSQTRFYWGDDLDFSLLCKYANVKNYSGCLDGYQRTAPVGSYLPNGFGLYDVSGNVWEWCEDVWQDNYNNLPTDGSANLTLGDARRRVQRGGSWADNQKNTRSASRGGDLPTDRNDEDGFRLIAVPRR
jgi:formylglycine-generating enzyme required for sulfatase activity